MIDVAVRHIASELNQYLKKLFYISDDIVTIAHIGDYCDAANPQNKLVVSLINIAEDQTPTRASQAHQASAYQTVGTSTPLSLDLQILISANFNPEKYQESLKFITYTIEFFQKNTLFTAQNYPAIESEIAQLTMSLDTLNIQEWNGVWSSMGCRSMPAMMYSAKILGHNDSDKNEYLAL